MIIDTLTVADKLDKDGDLELKICDLSAFLDRVEMEILRDHIEILLGRIDQESGDE